MNRERGERRTTGGPPRLKLALLRKLKFVLLVNTLPWMIGAYLLWKWSQGEIAFRMDSDDIWTVLFISLVACVVVGVGSWVVMPFGRWLRDYPRWQWRNAEAPLLWAVPMIGGWLAWLALWIAVCVASVGVLAVVGLTFWSLFTE